MTLSNTTATVSLTQQTRRSHIKFGLWNTIKDIWYNFFGLPRTIKKIVSFFFILSDFLRNC